MRHKKARCYLEVAKQRNMDVSLVPGEAAQELVTRVLDSPKAVAEKAKEITEDDLTSAENEIQKMTDNYVKKVDEMLATKERDIMEV